MANPLYYAQNLYFDTGKLEGTLTIPVGTTKVLFSAFINYKQITAISIPYSVTSIGNYAFYGCSKVKTVSFATYGTSSNLTYIGFYSFYNCSALTYITIPSGVTVIEEYAFAYCSSLERVNHESNSSSLHTIASLAFAHCTSLVSFTITYNVTDIDGYAFSGCSSLERVVFLDTSGWYWASSVATEPGSAKDVTDPAQNAKDFTSLLYHFYFWNKQ